MRGSLKTSSRWCARCKSQVAAVSNSWAWGCGDLILVLLTFGLWVLVKLTIAILANPWRCPNCGQRV